MIGLAAVEVATGTISQAAGYAHRALRHASDGGYRVLEGQALTVLADICCRQHEYGRGLDYASRALANHRETGHRPGEARTLAILGHLRRASGDPEAARHHWRVARELFNEMGAEPPEDLPEVSGGGPG